MVSVGSEKEEVEMVGVMKRRRWRWWGMKRKEGEAVEMVGGQEEGGGGGRDGRG